MLVLPLVLLLLWVSLMETDTTEFRRTKGAIATLGAIAVGLHAGYQFLAVGRIGWTTLGFLFFLIAAALGNRYLARLGTEHGQRQTSDGPH